MANKTHNTAVMAEMVATKVAEMESRLADLLADPSLSDNTKKTQKFQRQTQIHNMKVLETILNQCSSDDFTFSEEEDKWFVSMTTLTAVREAKTAVVLNAGDSLATVLQKYKEVKDIYNKVMKAAEKNGLVIDNTGTFVRA